MWHRALDPRDSEMRNFYWHLHKTFFIINFNNFFGTKLSCVSGMFEVRPRCALSLQKKSVISLSQLGSTDSHAPLCTCLHFHEIIFLLFYTFFFLLVFLFFSLALFHSQTSRLGRKVFFFFINFLKWTFTTHEVVLLHCAEANQLHARLIYILAIKLCENFINFPEKLDKIEATENLFC